MSNETDFKNDTEVEAYDYGQNAYWCTSETTLANNPYPEGTRQHKAWMLGWVDAHEDDSE